MDFKDNRKNRIVFDALALATYVSLRRNRGATWEDIKSELLLARGDHYA